MAYQSGRLRLISGGLSNAGFNEWLLDTVDPIATVNTDGYVSDGALRGLNVGDILTVRVWDAFPQATQQDASLPIPETSTITAFSQMIVSAKGEESVDLSDGSAISTANAD